jgi:hypothetical protein
MARTVMLAFLAFVTALMAVTAGVLLVLERRERKASR